VVMGRLCGAVGGVGNLRLAGASDWLICDGMALSSSSSRAERLEARLAQTFSPTVLRIQDDSARHAGHAGAQPGGQTHYSVLLVAEAFRGQSRVARSRAVHDALAAEFGPPETGGMHALSLILRTPEEHAASST